MFTIEVKDNDLILLNAIFRAKSISERDTAFAKCVDTLFQPVADELVQRDDYQALINDPSNFPIPEQLQLVYVHATQQLDPSAENIETALSAHYYQTAKNFLQREVPVTRCLNQIKALAEINYNKFYKKKANEFAYDTTIEQAVEALEIEQPDYAGFGVYLSPHNEVRRNQQKNDIAMAYYRQIQKLHSNALARKQNELEKDAEEAIKPLFETFITEMVSRQDFQEKINKINFTAFDVRIADKNTILYMVLSSHKDYYVEFIQKYLSDAISARKTQKMQGRKEARQAILDRLKNTAISFFTGLFLVVTGQAFYRDFRDQYSRKDDTLLIPTLGAPFAVLLFLFTSTVGHLFGRPMEALSGFKPEPARKVDPNKPFNKITKNLGVIIGAGVAVFSAIALVGILGTIPGVTPAFASAASVALNQLGSFFGFFPTTPWFTPFVIPMMYTTLATLTAAAITYYPAMEKSFNGMIQKIADFQLDRFWRNITGASSVKPKVRKEKDTELQPLNESKNGHYGSNGTKDQSGDQQSLKAPFIKGGPEYMGSDHGSKSSEGASNESGSDNNNNNSVKTAVPTI